MDLSTGDLRASVTHDPQMDSPAPDSFVAVDALVRQCLPHTSRQSFRPQRPVRQPWPVARPLR